jgi:GNAT superfamily N-acetyltransferase
VPERTAEPATDRPVDGHGVALIRNHPATSEEINRLRSAAWDRVGDQDWEPVLRRGLGWVCALDGEQLIGFVNVAWDGGVHAFLLDTTVHPRAQRRGVGTAMVREAAALARERGAEWLHVDYDPHLAGFYQGCGFAPTPAGLLDLSR